MNANNQKPNVLFIASQPYFQWRGSPIRLGFDVKAINENGYNVDFLTLPIGERKNVEGVNIIRTPNLFFAKKISIGPSPLKLAFDFVMLIHSLILISKKHYDVIHGVEDCSLIALILSKLVKAKSIFEKHSDSKSYKKGLLIKLYSKLESFIIKNVDAVIGTGPGLVEQVKAISSTPAYHISDIPSSLEEPKSEEVCKAAESIGKTNENIVATYVGSFAYYQGIDLLFQSIPIAVKKCDKLRFIIIGGSEKEIAERKEFLSSQGCENNVAFIGMIPPDILPNYLAASDILLSPRIAGVNTPLKLLDYLKVSRAIVATNHEANKLILDESTSLLTDISPEAFGEGVATLANNNDLRNKISANCRKLIDTKYNFNVFKASLADCYSKTLKS